MHIGKSYGFLEFLIWTRRRATLLLVNAGLAAGLYLLAGWHWLALPWPVVAILGTAASFIVGFKNAQTYARSVEAQQVWTTITSLSRYWGLISRDFPVHAGAARDLVLRHLAWLTVVRYQLRAPRSWEAAGRAPDVEYRSKAFRVAEHTVPLAQALSPYVPAAEMDALLASGNPAGMLIAQQSQAIRQLYTGQELVPLHHAEMQKTLKEFLDQHARAERIKNFPYPRQYAIINTVFVWTFALLLPLGVVREFAQIGTAAGWRELMGWLAVPFSTLVAWMYVALDQVGESTENPFEGSANDVPITYICQGIERESRTLLGEQGLPEPAGPDNHIVL
ncbi:bestrophin family protein [Massilia sp. DD77]|uniref:bestrophin family protein n=1 Tax=Massilia sp. DD77 TaxID=3109349 RepID=UPI002FFFE1CC